MASTISSDIDSSAMKHHMYRAGITGAMFIGYSTLVLGNGVSTSTLLNAGLASASAVAAETTVRYVVPHVTTFKAQGLNSGLPMVAEAGLTGLYYSMAFPRVFPALGGSVDTQQLALVGAGLDAASQVVAPRLAAMLEGQQAY